jgi:hypothetical protein
MTNEQTATIVLKDKTGSYFLVPQATVEQGRVPAERKAEIERMLADAEGFAAAVYEDDWGWKGRPGTNPVYQPSSAGGGFDPWGPIFLTLVVIGAIVTPGPGGDPAPPGTPPLY